MSDLERDAALSSQLHQLQTITGSTEFAGVIGDPVAHSLSPRLHNRAYEVLGLDIRYGAFRVPAGEAQAAILGARALGFRGLSVTTPHKDDAARFADQRSDDVASLGAANTIVFLSGAAVALSTDGEGLLGDLEHGCDFIPAGRRCVVLGAGGAARAVILALVRAAAGEIIVVNRSADRAEEAVRLAGSVGRLGALEDSATADLVINATSAGLGSRSQGSPGEPGSDGGASLARFVGARQLALDLSYRPSRTPFLEASHANGAKIRNGLGMLVHQAAAQVRHFSGHEAPLEQMWESVREYPTS